MFKIFTFVNFLSFLLVLCPSLLDFSSNGQFPKMSLTLTANSKYDVTKSKFLNKVKP